MPVLSIFCRFVSWVTGGSSVLLSVSLSAMSSRTCEGRWSCCARGSASRFRLSPRLWSVVCRVVVRKRVILGCDVTLCLCRLAPGAYSVLVRFFRGPRCHCLAHVHYDYDTLNLINHNKNPRVDISASPQARPRSHLAARH